MLSQCIGLFPRNYVSLLDFFEKEGFQACLCGWVDGIKHFFNFPDFLEVYFEDLFPIMSNGKKNNKPFRILDRE